MASLGCRQRTLALAQVAFPRVPRRLFSSPSSPIEVPKALQSSPGLWGAFIHWAYRNFGGRGYPPNADICNCGASTGVQLPRPDLLRKAEGIKEESREWQMKMYGTSLYYYLATMAHNEKIRQASVDLLRDKDVLEVACMRGGGAWYLSQVLGPRRYVATDKSQEHIDTCFKMHTQVDGLEFAVADAMSLEDKFDAESFDFVLCVQAAAEFVDIRRFLVGVRSVLRRNGQLFLCDAYTRDSLKTFLDACDECGLEVEATQDLSRAVHAVGICQIPKGVSYLRIVVRKVE